MNQFKIVFIALLIGLFTSGCYTVVYLEEDDDYVEEIAYEPPPQPYPIDPPYRPPHRPPVQPPIVNPIIIVLPPVAPPPEYKTRQPGDNDSGNRKRDDGIIDPKRNGGGRGNDGGRR